MMNFILISCFLPNVDISFVLNKVAFRKPEKSNCVVLPSLKTMYFASSLALWGTTDESLADSSHNSPKLFSSQKHDGCVVHLPLTKNVIFRFLLQLVWTWCNGSLVTMWPFVQAKIFFFLEVNLCKVSGSFLCVLICMVTSHKLFHQVLSQNHFFPMLDVSKPYQFYVFSLTIGIEYEENFGFLYTFL